jgi:AraC-like DNA-binding protein
MLEKQNNRGYLMPKEERITMSEISCSIFATAPRIKSMRVLEYDNVYATKEHKSVSHELLYILEGRMTLHLGENLTFHGTPGDFLLIPSQTPHRDEFLLLKGLRILLIHFEWDKELFFQSVNNRALTNLSYETRNEARRRVEFLRTRWEKNSEFAIQNASLQLHSLLALFYYDIMQNSTSNTSMPPPSPAIDAMRRVKHFLNQNFASQITLKEAADFAGISSSYLSRQFHHEYGISFNAYLTARRLEAAQHLLHSSRLQTGEIAAQCGFNSVSYFIRVYKQHYGVTPRKHIGMTEEKNNIP